MSGDRRRLVLIGAGSAVFTRGLVADLIVSPDLGPWSVGLVDIDPGALQTAEGLCRRMVEAQGADIDVDASLDRRELLSGADVVVTTIGVGGRRAWEDDVRIPRRYGIYQPVGDTVMPGGISRAMRMIPAMIDIARDVGDLCPDALFFNYGNPMTANCWAVRKATGVPVVGLCHGTFHVERQLAAFIGAPPEQVTSTFVGLNHLTFILDLRWRGRDAWPLARARLAEGKGEAVDWSPLQERFPEWEGYDASAFPAGDNPFSWSLFETLDAYPAVNDRHVVEFFPERFPGGRYQDGTLGVDVFSIERTIEGGDRTYAEMRAQALGEQPLDRRIFARGPGEHEQLVEILRAIWGDERRVYAVNLPNRGAVPNLPGDAVLEMPAVAMAGGLRGVQILDLPEPLAAILARKLAATRLTVEAALRGSRDLLVEAMWVDGAVSDPDVALRLADDLLLAQRPYLPQFFAGGRAGGGARA
jgi:alpha-galactosidase